MKVVKLAVLVLFVAMLTVGCAAHQYTMGDGATKGQTEQARQWYILWGLVPLNSVDTATMIGDAENYEVRTAQEPIDVVMNIVTGYVTVNSRTVTVKK